MAQTESLQFQLLSCRVEVAFDDPALEATLQYMAETAEQTCAVRKTLRYAVEGSGPYAVFEEGDPLGRWESPGDVLYVIYGRVYRRVLERFMLARWVVLHAALANIKGTRTLLLGDKGAGKTTLSTRLLFDGHDVEGDETVLVRNGLALALPRRFHFKPNIERQVPELADAVADLPKTYAGPTEVSAFDPAVHGFPWKIAVGPIDRVVWITANHGGETALVPQASFPMIQFILKSAIEWGETRDLLVAVATEIAGKGGFELILGNAADAAKLLAE